MLIFFPGLFSNCLAQSDIENADDALNKINSIVDIPELQNINASALPVAEVENLVKKKCEKNGGPTAYDTAKTGIMNMGSCMASLVNVTQLNNEIEKAKPTGDLDEVFAKYCRKSIILKECVENLTNSLEPCLEPPEQALEPIILNITNSLLDFVCFKEGDRIACNFVLFIIIILFIIYFLNYFISIFYFLFLIFLIIFLIIKLILTWHFKNVYFNIFSINNNVYYLQYII